KAPVDSWAAQIWGPLMLENLIYGGLLLILGAFVWRYQVRLPTPEPWQGAYPPYRGVRSFDLLWLGKLYGGALVLTAAGAYSNLLGIGMAVLLLLTAFWVFLPFPLAALALLAGLRLLAMTPVPDPTQRKPAQIGLLPGLTILAF